MFEDKFGRFVNFEWVSVVFVSVEWVSVFFHLHHFYIAANANNLS